MAQYLIPGEDAHDETAGEGQYLAPGGSFLDHEEADTSIEPGAGTITITGHAPTVSQSDNQSLTPDAGALTITGHAPTVSQSNHIALEPGAGALTITGHVPTVARTVNNNINPSAGTLSITGHAPTVERTTGVSADWVFTLEIEVPANEDGDPENFYFATDTLITSDVDTPAETIFKPLISDPGRLSREVFVNGRASGVLAPSWGGASFDNTSGDLDPWLDFGLDGAKVTCRYGPKDKPYPSAFTTVYVAYVDGPINIDYYTAKLDYRGREWMFDRDVCPDAFTGDDPELEGTGIANDRRKQILLGGPLYIPPILLNKTDNIWFVFDNNYDGRPTVYDGGHPLGTTGSNYSSPSQMLNESAPNPGDVRFAKDAHGPVYFLAGSPHRLGLTALATGSYSSATETERRWNIVDLARRAGILEVDSEALPSGSTVFDAGNRLIEKQTYRDVFNDIAVSEFACIGLNRLDQFFARLITPSFEGADPTYAFVDGQNSWDWSALPNPALARRIYKLHVNSGETRKSPLTKIVQGVDETEEEAEDRADVLSREPWLTQFDATADSVLESDPGAKEEVVSIAGNAFADEDDMQDYADAWFALFGSRGFFLSLTADFRTDTLNLELLDKVSVESDRLGCGVPRDCRIIGIELMLQEEKIRFDLWSHSDPPELVDVTAVDQTTVPEYKPVESYVVVCSDEVTALTTGTAKVTYQMPVQFSLLEVIVTLTTAQASGSLFTVDVNVDGTSRLSTKATVNNTHRTSATATTPCVISDPTIDKGAEVTIDIDQIGNGTAKGLKVNLIGYQTA